MSDKSRFMEYLPAMFREHPFLGKFLIPFERKLDEMGLILDQIARFFDPYLTDKEFLPWLSSWVALVMDPEWQEPKQRELIAKALDLYRRRGTVGGLKQYLKIYTGMEPEIREWHWPGGMQIGVASQIGGLFDEGGAKIPVVNDIEPIGAVMRYEPIYRDYYVVTMDMNDPSALIYPAALVTPGFETPAMFYFPVNPAQIRRVDVGKDAGGTPFVDMTLVSDEVYHFAPATVTRRDHLIHDTYPVIGVPEEHPEGVQAEYRGDTFLIDELEGEDYLPYHFIVDVKIPPEEKDHVKMDKIRAIVDLEKPAHTVYYLKLTYVESREMLSPMQIEVRSDIGINTIVG